MPGIPVVISTNGRGTPVKQVNSGAPVMTVAQNGLGIPIVLGNVGQPFVVEGAGIVLSAYSVPENSATDTVVGALSVPSHPSGSSGWSYVLTSQSRANWFKVVSGSLKVATVSPDYETDRFPTVTITASKSGQTDLVRTFQITVSNVFEAASLSALSFSGTLTQNASSPITIGNKTSGSTLSLVSGSLPAGMSLGASSITGTPTTLGTGSATIRETLADSANSPRDTVWSWEVVVAPAIDPDPAAVSWGSAQLIGLNTNGDTTLSGPAAVARKTFTISKTVTKATLQVGGLCVYVPYVNGTRVGDHELAPGWTDYTQRVQFQTYDVRSLLVSGSNAVGVEIGDGWAHGNMSTLGRNYYGNDFPRARVALYLEYSDATNETIVSDNTWKATTSDNTKNDIYNGSTHDLRELIDWSNPATSDAAWSSCNAISAGAVPYVKQPSPPIRRKETLTPVARTNPSAGVYIFDFGQNHAGFCTLTVEGASSGDSIQLRHAEALLDDGTLYTANLRSAAQTDTFISAGGATEVFEPRHTYHGFRYVEVTGYPGVPPMDCLTSNVIYQDGALVSTFNTSSSTFNDIWSNTVWSLKSNALSVPTDCPQRNERLGWTLDAFSFSTTAPFIMECASFLDKYCTDMELSVGAALNDVGDTAPFSSDTNRGTAGWGEAMIFIPWRLYEIYGDDAYLSTHWDTMKLVLAALPYTNRFGDHLTETSTTGDVIRYAMAYRAAYIMKQAAIVLGDSAAETDADTAIASFSASFNALVSGGGATIGNNTHTCYALALGMPDLLPSGQRQTAVDALAASIISTGHITSGFLGINWIYDVLADNGYLDLAYTHTERTASPSLGYDISQGMTTLGERLGAMGYRNDGVHDDSNSMNHPSRCGMAGWFVRTVVGIDAYAPGFTTVLLRPRPGGTLTSADMTFDSPAGAISTSWALGAGSMTWDFTLPVDGVVVIPEGYLTSDLGAGTPMSADPITGGDRYSVPAGTYSITCYSAPVVTSNPTISPTGGSSTDTYTANDGAADYDTSHTRRWLLDGSPIGTGTTVVPGAEGELVLEVTWSGLGPDTVVTSAAATISDSWSPAQLPTGALVAEWDYAIAGNISHTAGSITQVNDNSGNGHHLTPTGGTVTYNATGGPDSAGSVSQLYTAGYLTASVPAASFPNGLLMLSVWKYTGPGFDEGILPMNRDGGGSGAAEVAGWGGTTRVCGDTTFGWAASSSAPDIKETAWNLHEAQGSTAGYFERKNCVQTFTMASPNYADNATGLRIGRNTHSGQMSMDLLYQCAVRLDLLGAGDLERLQAYPLWKRGLQSLLPAGHTYESSPP